MTDEHATNRSTVCPECAVGCRLGRGDGDRAAGRRGAVNRDGRLCPSGLSAFEGYQSRFTEPQIRRSGELTPVSWERAYERAVEGINQVLETDGPSSLAFLGAPHCTNEENYLLQKLARVLGTNNVDNRSRLCHVETARTLSERLGWPASTNSLTDLRSAETILVVGANPARRQPIAYNSYVRPAVNDGATLIHVDPVGNETTRLADIHIAPRPNMDGLVCDLLSALVLEAGTVDSRFVAERTTAFEDFRSGLERLDTSTAAEVAGVSLDTLAAASKLVANRSTAAITGTGIEGGAEAVSSPDALLNLLLLTGNIGSEGTGYHLFRGLANEQGATDAGCVPDRLPGHQPVADRAVRKRIGAVWGVEPPAEPGADADALLAGFGEEIRAAVVVGENPAVSKHEQPWIENRLAGLDTLVVVDITDSETTPHADVVLPGARLVEKRGTITNLDRQVQHLQPVDSPPGAARTEFRILQDLAGRLASTEATEADIPAESFDVDSPRQLFDEMGAVSAVFETTHVGTDWESYRWPENKPVLYRDSFETGDGRAAFRPVQPVDTAPESDGLRLVVGGRAGDAARQQDGLARVNPADAKSHGIEAEQTVVLSDESTFVTARLTLDESVRRGTVFLHATVADPLVRTEGKRVSVGALPRESKDRSREVEH